MGNSLSIMVMSTLAVTYATIGKERLQYEEREQRDDLINDEFSTKLRSVSMFKLMREEQRQDLRDLNDQEILPRFRITNEEALAQTLLLAREEKERQR